MVGRFYEAELKGQPNEYMLESLGIQIHVIEPWTGPSFPLHSTRDWPNALLHCQQDTFSVLKSDTFARQILSIHHRGPTSSVQYLCPRIVLRTHFSRSKSIYRTAAFLYEFYRWRNMDIDFLQNTKGILGLLSQDAVLLAIAPKVNNQQWRLMSKT